MNFPQGLHGHCLLPSDTANMNEGALANIAIILRLPLNRELIYVCLIIFKSKPFVVVLTTSNFVVFTVGMFY